jgi:hypothetical protein
MGQNRVFVPQGTLDVWMSDGRVVVDGETMTLHPEGQKFHLRTALHFQTELTGAGDPHGLVNRVKDLDQLAALGGEHVSDSVILGDHAYQVIEGFVGEPDVVAEPVAVAPAAAAADDVASGSSLDSAARAAVGEAKEGDVDLLAKFFLSSR